MGTVTRIGDRIAICAALVCSLHCFLTPVFLSMLPSLQALSIVSDERFHLWILVSFLPISLISLVIGCKKHKRFTFFGFGLFGLMVLGVAALWGHDLVGHEYESYLTLAGSLIISFAHVNNYLLCRSQSC